MISAKEDQGGSVMTPILNLVEAFEYVNDRDGSIKPMLMMVIISIMIRLKTLLHKKTPVFMEQSSILEQNSKAKKLSSRLDENIWKMEHGKQKQALVALQTRQVTLSPH